MVGVRRRRRGRSFVSNISWLSWNGPRACLEWPSLAFMGRTRAFVERTGAFCRAVPLCGTGPGRPRPSWNGPEAFVARFRVCVTGPGGPVPLWDGPEPSWNGFPFVERAALVERARGFCGTASRLWNGAGPLWSGPGPFCETAPRLRNGPRPSGAFVERAWGLCGTAPVCGTRLRPLWNEPGAFVERTPVQAACPGAFVEQARAEEAPGEEGARVRAYQKSPWAGGADQRMSAQVSAGARRSA